MKPDRSLLGSTASVLEEVASSVASFPGYLLKPWCCLCSRCYAIKRGKCIGDKIVWDKNMVVIEARHHIAWDVTRCKCTADMSQEADGNQRRVDRQGDQRKFSVKVQLEALSLFFRDHCSQAFNLTECANRLQ